MLIVATLCFAPDPTAVLREAARVLRPTGQLLVALIPAESPWGRHYLLKNSRGHPFYRFAQFFTVDRLETMLHVAGLEPPAASSTLVQSQPGILRREKVQTGFMAEAGFVTVLARRNGSDLEMHPHAQAESRPTLAARADAASRSGADGSRTRPAGAAAAGRDVGRSDGVRPSRAQQVPQRSSAPISRITLDHSYVPAAGDGRSPVERARRCWPPTDKLLF